jgi:hypothetical protein
MKKYRRLLDPLNFKGLRGSRKVEENETWWDKISNNCATLGTIDLLILRRKKNKTTIGETIYWIIMFPVAPLLDLLIWVVGPILVFCGMLGQVKLPDLDKFQTPEPDDSFEPETSPASQKLNKRKFIKPGGYFDDAKLGGQCDRSLPVSSWLLLAQWLNADPGYCWYCHGDWWFC